MGAKRSGQEPRPISQFPWNRPCASPHVRHDLVSGRVIGREHEMVQSAMPTIQWAVGVNKRIAQILQPPGVEGHEAITSLIPALAEPITLSQLALPGHDDAQSCVQAQHAAGAEPIAYG